MKDKTLRRSANEDYIGSSKDTRYLNYIEDMEPESQEGIPQEIIPGSEAALHFEKHFLINNKE